MTMKKLFVSFAISGLFIVAFFSFIVDFQENNGVTDTIANDPIINRTLINLNSEFSDYQTKANNQSVNQDEDNPLTEGGSLLFISITKTGKVIKGMIGGVYNVIIIIPSKLLGVPQIVIIVINSIVSIILILAAWRLYKAGE